MVTTQWSSTSFFPAVWMTTPAGYSPCQCCPYPGPLWTQSPAGAACWEEEEEELQSWMELHSPELVLRHTRTPQAPKGPTRTWALPWAQQPSCPFRAVSRNTNSPDEEHIWLFSVNVPLPQHLERGWLPATSLHFSENTGKHSKVVFSQVQVGMRNTVVRQEGPSILTRQHLSLQLSWWGWKVPLVWPQNTSITNH